MPGQGSPDHPHERDWSALFDPRSVAIVGASADPAKWGNILSRRALHDCGDRPVTLVNRRAGRVLGRPTVPSLTGHEPVDLAVLCVPAPGLLAAVEDAVAAGARALVVITAGLAELGAQGAALQQSVVAVARAAGALLVGPNCIGVADTGARLQLGHAVLPPGPVAVLSQSGNVGLDLAGLLADRGLGVSRFVSVGNQADVGIVELLVACRDHRPTRAVVVYAETVGDGRAFVAAARGLEAAGKPVVLLAPGRSQAAIRSAASHTGALTTAAHVIEAACRAAGVHSIEDPTRAADVVQALLSQPRLDGRRIAVLTDGGGHGAIAADAVARAGLETPVLADDTRAGLAGVLWATSVADNPVDLAGAGDSDHAAYAAVGATLLTADDVDGVLLTGYFGGYSAQGAPTGPAEVAAAADLAAAARAAGKPLIVHSVHPGGPTGDVLRAAGVPVHRDIDRAAAALRALAAARGDARPLPPPAPAVDDTSYAASRELFAAAGIAFPAARAVRSPTELTEALARLQPPWVLKAAGALHKSDAGGVLLGLADASAARAGYLDLVARLAPPAVSVEEMADLEGGVELLVGAVRDPSFGPVLTVGLGGVHAEVLADVACALAPVSPESAAVLLTSLRGAALLSGVRGRPAVDLMAVADTVAAFSEVVAAHPEIAEAELNPLLALPDTCLALDARVVLAT